MLVKIIIIINLIFMCILSFIWFARILTIDKEEDNELTRNSVRSELNKKRQLKNQIF